MNLTVDHISVLTSYSFSLGKNLNAMMIWTIVCPYFVCIIGLEEKYFIPENLKFDQNITFIKYD